MGGELCQLSNLIFWMTLHTPLTVNELVRLTYDLTGACLGEEFLFANDAIMMYSPLLSEPMS